MSVATMESRALLLVKPARWEITKQELEQTLEQHRKWVESHGAEGIQADLSCANLAGAGLAGVNLQRALLRRANLVGADLSSAQLQGACLAQANLQRANLLGTQLREASLEGASLEGATGLAIEQLGGANLHHAALPEPLSDFEDLKAFRKAVKGVYSLFKVVLLLSLVLWPVISATTDVGLLKNSAFVPVRALAKVIPMVGFYLLAPLLLFALHVYFHFCAQRLWQAVATLPVILPDGRALDRLGPWPLMGLARRYFRWQGEGRLQPSLLETAIPLLMALWVVPSTLLLFWLRYLPRQDIRGSLLHVSLVVSAVFFATFQPDMIRKTIRADYLEPKQPRSRFFNRGTLLLLLGGVLFLLSFGAIYGIPADARRAQEIRAADFRKWAPLALNVLGYNPFAEIAESDLSFKPADWSGREEELARVEGARMNKLSLRYAEAHRAFLVNAHLWQSDLEGANLSEADLRGANLRQASLPSAILDRAKLNRANLQGATLENANLTRADLSDADLSFSSLAGALLIDTKLERANLYRASLRGAWLSRPDLQNADLREAHLEQAKLQLADLRGADLWFAKLAGADLRDAQTQNAILLEADLHEADLRGANLQGAILRGADLMNANLDGADLRDAKGLSAGQVCSAFHRYGVKLDEILQREVDAMCGTLR